MFQENPFSGACTFATLEVLSMLIGTLLLGILLGYLIWGWIRRRLELTERELAKKTKEIAHLETEIRGLESIARRNSALAVASTHKLQSLKAEHRRKESVIRKHLARTATFETRLLARVGQPEAPVIIEAVEPYYEQGLSGEMEETPFLPNTDSPIEAPTFHDEAGLVRATRILGREVTFNDLTVIEGVGPRIAEVLAQSGITSWEILSKQTKHVLRVILDEAGPEFRMHKPKTWPRQARMAADGEWKSSRPSRMY